MFFEDYDRHCRLNEQASVKSDDSLDLVIKVEYDGSEKDTCCFLELSGDTVVLVEQLDGLMEAYVPIHDVSAPLSAAGGLSMDTNSVVLEFNEPSESLMPQAGWVQREARKQTRSKTPRKKHPCTTCGKQFTSLSHASTHDISASFMCEICGRMFRQHASLGRHKRYDHASQSRERTNPQSAEDGKAFRDRSVSKRRMIRHSAETSYFCLTCSQMFPNRGALHKHKLLQHDKVPVDKVAKHECAVCKRWFEDTYKLKRHSVVHTKQRPFVCVLCAKAYSHPSALRRHHRTKHRH
ncbi:Zinc finger X-chromosomal protein [Clonorchis sinensis]|uniref:Zinc finger X-chromosomal protein n=1 Tax=Clonorchis sinensis TaxID=79923 RepID=A0A8T1MD22_CLOSI|nr:Zinc finger X-chromosomal protein [Clonorchis sinensis]